MIRVETAQQRLDRIHHIWPEAQPNECKWIEPIGSRNDALLFWRKGQRVSTGMKGTTQPCFEGSLQDFYDKVIGDYDRRIRDAYSDHHREQMIRFKAEYLAAYEFFRALVGGGGK